MYCFLLYFLQRISHLFCRIIFVQVLKEITITFTQEFPLFNTFLAIVFEMTIANPVIIYYVMFSPIIVENFVRVFLDTFFLLDILTYTKKLFQKVSNIISCVVLQIYFVTQSLKTSTRNMINDIKKYKQVVEL